MLMRACAHTYTDVQEECAHMHTGACTNERVDLLAFSLEEIRIARAHSDPIEGHHQDP